MRAVHKYPLTLTDTQVIEFPLGAQILSVQEQHGTLTMWVLNDLQPIGMVPYRIRIHGTGHTITEYPGEYVGTVQQHDGNLVWHVFAQPI